MLTLPFAMVRSGHWMSSVRMIKGAVEILETVDV